MLLALLTSLAFSFAPKLGRFELEPWRYGDPTQLLSMCDSAEARKQAFRVIGIHRDSGGVVRRFDTTILWRRDDRIGMEQRFLDLEETPPIRVVYTSVLSGDELATDSSRESIWNGDSLVTVSVASTSLDGGRRILRSVMHHRSTSAGTTHAQSDSAVAIRDESGHLVYRHECSAWATSENGILRTQERSCNTDSILWSGDTPLIWKERDTSSYSGTGSFEGASTSGSSAAGTTHHLAWDRARLLVDSAVTTSTNGALADSIRTRRCSWKDSLLEACTDNGVPIVEMRHDRFGRPTYRWSDIDNTIESWAYDALGRTISHRLRRPGIDAMITDSLDYGTSPWPVREFKARCDSNGNACRTERAIEFTFAYLDATGVSPRARPAPRTSARMRGDILVLTNLPRDRGELRIVDAQGRQVAGAAWRGSSAHIVVPAGSGPLFWIASTLDGSARISGIVPSF